MARKTAGKMPTQVRVGYRDYRIEEWSPSEATAADRDGECGKRNAVIRIRSDLEPYYKAEVLVHEILHAAYDMGDLKGDEGEEKVVTVFAVQLAQIWRDNPQFVAFMESTFRS